MRGRNRDHDGSGDDRIINPEGETAERLKAMLDAQWDREDSETKETAETEVQAE